MNIIKSNTIQGFQQLVECNNSLNLCNVSYPINNNNELLVGLKIKNNNNYFFIPTDKEFVNYKKEGIDVILTMNYKHKTGTAFISSKTWCDIFKYFISKTYIKYNSESGVLIRKSETIFSKIIYCNFGHLPFKKEDCALFPFRGHFVSSYLSSNELYYVVDYYKFLDMLWLLKE